VKFKVYPTPGFNQPVIWLARELTARHGLKAEEIEHVHARDELSRALYPSPRFPRPPAATAAASGARRTWWPTRW
jgi:hypothetical protein